METKGILHQKQKYSMKIDGKIRKELSSWALPLLVLAILYATGLHTEVVGAVQRVFLSIGISKPDTSPSEANADAEYLPYSFYLKDKDGTIVSADNFRNKVLFINHWATWCPPCVAEMPNIQSLYNKVDTSKVAFIMISFDKDPDKAQRFTERKGHTFPVYFPASPLPSLLESEVIPTTFVIAADGRLVSKKEGMAHYDTDEFLAFLHSLAEN